MFFGAFSFSRDNLIKTGSLIAGIGLGWNILIAILQMAGIYVFVLVLLGALVTIAGEVIVYIRFITLLSEGFFGCSVLFICIIGASVVVILDMGKYDIWRWVGWLANLFLRP